MYLDSLINIIKFYNDATITGVAVNISLASNLIERVAYHGQRVICICTIFTRNDVVITWESAHYIGTEGDDLQLISTDPEGSIVTNLRNPTTVATLVNTTRSNGMITTISELQLTASLSHPTCDVSCRVTGHESASLTLRKSDINLCILA